MQVLAPVTLSGSGQSISLGTQGTVGAAVIANESLYALQVTAGGYSRWIPAFTIDLVQFGNSGFTGSISLTLQSYLDYGGAAPSATAFITIYAPGETIQGSYPASLTRVTNVGNTVSTTTVSQLVNDGNAAGTQIVEATASGSSASDVILTNDGKLTLSHTLTVKGASSLDNGAVTTNGSGAVSAASVTTTGQIKASNYLMALGPNTGLGVVAAGDVLDTDASQNVYLKAPTQVVMQIPSGTSMLKVQTANSGANTLLVSRTTSGTASGIGFATYTGSAGLTPFSVGGQVSNASTYIGNDGSFDAIAGQTAVGNLGVPVIVAQMASPLHVTDTASHTLFTFTPPVNGLYRLMFDGITTNTGGTAVLKYAYTEGFTSTAQSITSGFLNTYGGTLPASFYAASGHTITVSYQNAAASPVPNDWVYASLERLS